MDLQKPTSNSGGRVICLPVTGSKSCGNGVAWFVSNVARASDKIILLNVRPHHLSSNPVVYTDTRIFH
jgi:hypothetical protein